MRDVVPAVVPQMFRRFPVRQSETGEVATDEIPTPGEVASELIRIGRRGGLGRAKVKDVPVLCTLTRVQANAASDDSADLLRALGIVLRQAVDEFPVDTGGRAVARALLGTEPGDAGLTVTDRYEAASLTRNNYYENRQRVADALSVWLVKQEQTVEEAAAAKQIVQWQRRARRQGITEQALADIWQARSIRDGIVREFELLTLLIHPYTLETERGRRLVLWQLASLLDLLYAALEQEMDVGWNAATVVGDLLGLTPFDADDAAQLRRMLEPENPFDPRGHFEEALDYDEAGKLIERKWTHWIGVPQWDRPSPHPAALRSALQSFIVRHAAEERAPSSGGAAEGIE